MVRIPRRSRRTTDETTFPGPEADFGGDFFVRADIAQYNGRILTVGLLHNAGKVAFAQFMPNEFHEALRLTECLHVGGPGDIGYLVEKANLFCHAETFS